MHPETALTDAFRLTKDHKRACARLGIETVRDLLYYFPKRYTDISELKQITELAPGDTATVYGKLRRLRIKKGFKSRRARTEGTLEDSSGTIQLLWFNQPYIAKTFSEGSLIQLTGTVTEGTQGLYIANPECEHATHLPIDTHTSLFAADNTKGVQFPIYKETKGLTSRFLYHTIKKILASNVLDQLDDYIPTAIREKYNLPSLKTALIWIHTPQKAADAQAARKRFSFEEVFFIQLHRLQERKELRTQQSYDITVKQEDIDTFTDRFPFSLTDAQKRVIGEITTDLMNPHPMMRLLEGDVGSGKTAVAATIAYAIATNQPGKQTYGNLQVAYMAPTAILAEQHFNSFIEYFKHTPIDIALVTGSTAKKFPSKVSGEEATQISRNQLLKWVENGEIPIVIGTHTLIEETVAFKHLALTIIDEQHRFGTRQRKALAQKTGFAPHFLSMTATPIPRTLALTIFGDLDISLLDTLPAGRKEIQTEIIPSEKREDVYEHIRTELDAGRQAFIICPRIDEKSSEDGRIYRSVRSEVDRLSKKVFQKYTVAGMHGKVKKDERERIMNDFAAGNIDILVATTVVEVGVDIPNATIMLIEDAERFGLAQLHQLRGRVMRSTHQAYCYVITESDDEKTHERLKALQTTKSGFELAEYDLQLRGTGHLIGTKQWGVSDVGMEAIRNMKMVEAARNEATAIIQQTTDLEEAYPTLAERLAHIQRIHFE